MANFEQREKAKSPILVTPSGIMIDAKLVQPENAPSSMLVTPLGSVIETMFLQLVNIYSLTLDDLVTTTFLRDLGT